MSFVIDKLQNFDYYESKLPMWLQNTVQFKEHFKIWFKVLQSVVGFGDGLLDSLRIFDPTQTLNHDVLVKLANLFDLDESMTIMYIDEEDQTITEQVNLNDEELAILVKCQIIKNYFDGTRQTIEEFFRSVNIDVYYIPYSRLQAECWIAYDNENPLSDNIIKMFYAGLLTIESLGIQYRKRKIDIKLILRWHDDVSDVEQYNKWDLGRWGA